MAKKFTSPPQHVEDALNEIIKNCYPKILEIPRHIEYEQNKSGYIAVITFYFPKKSSMALFEWKRKTLPNDREYSWCCTRDWND